jgi:hypothetical protein
VGFQKKYQIQAALSGGEVRVSRGLQLSTWQSVLIHQFAAGQASSQGPDLASLLFKFLRSDVGEKARDFIDMGEDDGAVYVVTTDVPECLDLRRWLGSMLDARAGKQAAPAAPKGSADSTRVFTTDTFRQALGLSESAAGPLTLSVGFPPAGDVSGAPGPPPEAAPESTAALLGGPLTFVGFWERSTPTNATGSPAPLPPKTRESNSALGPVPEGTVAYSSRGSPLSSRDGPPTFATPPGVESPQPEWTLEQAARWERESAQTKRGSNAAQPPSPAAGPAVAPTAEDDFDRMFQSPPPPAEPAAGTATASEFTRRFSQRDETPPSNYAPPATAPIPAANPAGKGAPDGKVEPNAGRLPVPTGFEVVFYRDKRELPADWPQLPGRPGVSPAPSPVVPPAPPEPLPKPAASVPRNMSLFTPEMPPETEPATRVVPPPAGPTVQRPPAASDGFPVSVGETVLAPAPANPTKRQQPGEYTRMLQNKRVVTLPPPPESPPPAERTGVVPTVTLAALPSNPSPYLSASKSAIYSTDDAPLYPSRRQPNAWMPLAVLTGLFLTALGLLLFYAFR